MLVSQHVPVDQLAWDEGLIGNGDAMAACCLPWGQCSVGKGKSQEQTVFLGSLAKLKRVIKFGGSQAIVRVV